MRGARAPVTRLYFDNFYPAPSGDRDTSPLNGQQGVPDAGY
jgi:hypothetical protein